jgi:two-component system alkaline phosphatase synthesis response regulator PhoP
MIYCLEDDASIRELVVYTLNSTGLEAEGFSRPSDFWTAMQKRLPGLIVLDIMLPEEDGLSILKRLRSRTQTKKIPIMMLTAKGSEYDKVIGLDSGADDYMAKPFGMMELISRTKALLRRSEGDGSAPEYRFGTLYVSPSKHIVKVENQEIELTHKEFELLCLLIENEDVVLTRDQLLNRVWGYSFDGESRTVDVHIRTLRQKLGSCEKFIRTVRGIGYKFSEA